MVSRRAAVSRRRARPSPLHGSVASPRRVHVHHPSPEKSESDGDDGERHAVETLGTHSPKGRRRAANGEPSQGTHEGGSGDRRNAMSRLSDMFPLLGALNINKNDLKKMFTHEERLPLPTLVALRSPAGHVLTALARSPESVNMQDGLGWTPLHHVCYHGDAQLAKALVDAGANVNARSPGDENTPLHWACVNGHAPCVAVLLEAGCVPDPRNSRGLRPADVARNKDIQAVLRGDCPPTPTDPSPSTNGSRFSTPEAWATTRPPSRAPTEESSAAPQDDATPASSRRIARRLSWSAQDGTASVASEGSGQSGGLHTSQSTSRLDDQHHKRSPALLKRSNTDFRGIARQGNGHATAAQQQTIAQTARRVLAPSNTTRWYLQLRALVTSEIFKNFASIVLVVLVEIFRAEFSAALRILVGSLTPALTILAHVFSVPRPLLTLLSTLFSPLLTILRMFWQPLSAILSPLLSHFVYPLWSTLVYLGRDVVLRTTWTAVKSVGHKLFLPVLRILHAMFAPVLSSLVSPFLSVLASFGARVLARLPEIVRPQTVLLLLVKAIDVLVQQFTPSWLYSRIHTASHRIFNERYNAVAESYYTAVLVTFVLVIALYVSIFVCGFIARLGLFTVFHFYPAAWQAWPLAREYSAFVGDFGASVALRSVCPPRSIADGLSVCVGVNESESDLPRAYVAGIAPASLRAALGIDARHHQLGIALILLFSIVNSLVYVARFAGSGVVSLVWRRRHVVGADATSPVAQPEGTAADVR
eukprot:Opistho-1_new@40072